jgi:opacity protein-like surface antigen
MHIRLALAALSLIVALPAAHAQGMNGALDAGSSRRVQFGIGGGAIVPRSNARFQEVLTGATGQGYLLLRVAPGFPSIRIGADFSRMKFGDPITALGTTPVGTTRTQLGGIASVKFDLLPGAIRPYILAGVGAFNIRDAITPSGNISAQSLNSTQVGFDGGAGLSFRMGRIAGFVETRLQNVYTKQQGLIDTKSIQSFPITFGILF